MEPEYEYFEVGTQRKVSLPEGSFLQRLFCKHDMVPLIRRQKDCLFLSLRGDVIQYVCCKCGKLGDTQIWEHEGNGYK